MVCFSKALHLAERLLSQLMPGACALCRQPACHGGYCRLCIRALPRNRPACTTCALPLHDTCLFQCARCLSKPLFDSAYAPFRYEGHMPALIHAFKFEADCQAISLLARLLHRNMPRKFSAEPWLITVPQHPDRAHARGFDHVDWLARLCPTTRSMRRLHALRQTWTAPLRGLNRQERVKAMKNAFALRDSVKGKHILLLDDVMTTGATLGALAALCRFHGAHSVSACAITRTPDHAWQWSVPK